MSEAVAYKILSRDDWRILRTAGAHGGSEADRRDGYIHLSAEDQLAETARRHYAGRDDLMVLTVDLAAVGEGVRWEPSRGGALFPHLHGDLPLDAVAAARAATVTARGQIVWGELVWSEIGRGDRA